MVVTSRRMAVTSKYPTYNSITKALFLWTYSMPLKLRDQLGLGGRKSRTQTTEGGSNSNKIRYRFGPVFVAFGNGVLRDMSLVEKETSFKSSAADLQQHESSVKANNGRRCRQWRRREEIRVLASYGKGSSAKERECFRNYKEVLRGKKEMKDWDDARSVQV
ncbi:hypothetical protein Ancab_007842 [Ancistrocladus abbreviatus]